jgi:hypothetical protein
MPTPFTHLVAGRRLLADEQVPSAMRATLSEHLGAFWLGNVAADAQVISSIKREDTHFYSYDRPMEDHPWRVMLATHPSLRALHGGAAVAFLAGYVAHLSMDEVWLLRLLRPHFAEREWAPRPVRFHMLNVLLIVMDERDYTDVNEGQHGISAALGAARSDHWLPFLPDDVLHEWGALIARQTAPGGVSETLEIIAPRIKSSPDELRALLDSRERLAGDLWAHIPPDLLAEVEAAMYSHARSQMITYLDEEAARP